MTDRLTMTLDDLKKKLPAAFGPIIDQYGATFLQMTIDEVWAWITLALNGKADLAYRAVLAKMPNGDLLAEWEKINADWNNANIANAAAIAWERDALMAVLRVLVAIAISVLGF